VLRKAALLLLALVVALPLAAALSACGAAAADLVATVEPTQTGANAGKARPGSEVEYLVVVANHGPGQATGVTVRIDLPSSFRYKSTTSVETKSIATRTQPSDPPVDSIQPLWGQWTLGVPGINADGTPARPMLLLKFMVKVNGKPGDYKLTPHVFSEGGDEVIGKVTSVHLLPASDLSMTIATDEQTVKRGDLVHYHVSVLNRGSGVAKGTGVLVTLPSGIAFDKTLSVSGNYTRAEPVDPITGALVVYYGGWVLPAGSEGRPGSLTIVFSAKVLGTALGGRYAVTAQMSNADGAVVSLGDSAPVTVSAPTPTPAPPSPTPTATRKP
jgi:uncharacterized repeat protein (TIGR01451 family)